jgi:hypothetical protein
VRRSSHKNRNFDAGSIRRFQYSSTPGKQSAKIPGHFRGMPPVMNHCLTEHVRIGIANAHYMPKERATDPSCSLSTG